MGRAKNRPDRSEPAAAAAPRSRGAALLDRLFAPVDASSMLLFRRCFGVVMVWQMLKYTYGQVLESQWIRPIFRFTYVGFEWLPRVSSPVFEAIGWTLLACAAAISLGLAARLACGAFAVLYGYLVLVDKANYNNHDYLITLVALVLAFLPIAPKEARGTAPAWSLYLLRFQIAMPYVFGGIAKLQSDWLRRAEPLKIWFADKAALSGRSDWLTSDGAAYAIGWGGAVFDLAIIPLLLWRRTRVVAAILALAFHLTNFGLFNIGVFPALMIAATGLFLDPGWPRRWRLVRRPAPSQRGGHVSVGVQWTIAAALAAYVGLQVFLPLRHFLIPGVVDWTEQGHTFAWRMKIRDKRGSLDFVAHSLDWPAPRPLPGSLPALLSPRQQQMMLHDPEMIRQLAAHLASEMREMGAGLVTVRVLTSISLNGRPAQDMIRPDVDLSELPAGLPAEQWIAPLAR